MFFRVLIMRGKLGCNEYKQVARIRIGNIVGVEYLLRGKIPRQLKQIECRTRNVLPFNVYPQAVAT